MTCYMSPRTFGQPSCNPSFSWSLPQKGIKFHKLMQINKILIFRAPLANFSYKHKSDCSLPCIDVQQYPCYNDRAHPAI